MPMRNKIPEFLKERNISAYRFIKDTGVAFATGYKLAKDPAHLPSTKVLCAICDRYKIQPSDVLEWTDDSPKNL